MLALESHEGIHVSISQIVVEVEIVDFGLEFGSVLVLVPVLVPVLVLVLAFSVYESAVSFSKASPVYWH